MRYLPLSLDLQGHSVLIAGDGDAATAKLRLLAKTDARLVVFSAEPSAELASLIGATGACHVARAIEGRDVSSARLVYAASDDAAEDARVVGLARVAGVLCNAVDNASLSDVLTPAIVDRSPVTVAIATEGAAPVLARDLKAKVEAMLPASTGTLARIAQKFRAEAATLPRGSVRRRFWQRYFGDIGPKALADGGESAVEAALADLATDTAAAKPEAGHVWLIGAGPGDAELLTLKARRVLGEADVVVYDRLVSALVLELARREARFVYVGKTPNGPSWRQEDISALLVEFGAQGLQVARLKSGDPAIFGRLDEEMDALDGAGIGFSIVPGVTAASAAAAAARVSMTKRGRNTSLRILTGHDTQGFAEHDWRTLAEPGSAAAIYMGVAAAKFLQGRLLMHGGDPATPFTVVENASGPNQKILSARLGTLASDMAAGDVRGPAILFLGLAPRQALGALAEAKQSQVEQPLTAAGALAR